MMTRFCCVFSMYFLPTVLAFLRTMKPNSESTKVKAAGDETQSVYSGATVNPLVARFCQKWSFRANDGDRFLGLDDVV